MTDRWIQLLPLVAFVALLLVADIIAPVVRRAWNFYRHRKYAIPPGTARHLRSGEVVIRCEDGRTFVATRLPRRR